MSKKAFVYYPEIEDDDFEDIIYHKKEFYDTRSGPGLYKVLEDPVDHKKYLNTRCDPNFFKLQN